MCKKSHEVMCQIIPPFMLEAMAQSPDAAVRGAALKNIAAAERARTTRATLAEARPQMRSIVPIDASSKLYRVVHDARLRDNLNGKVIREEGGPNTGDKEVDEAYRFAGDVHGFYKKVFGRNSLDDHGLTLKSTVRYREDEDEPYNNAFWWMRQMAYGDGDGVVFKRFTASLDVIGHELTHGVVEFTANLEYRSEPGALNESFADVFGSMIKQWRKKQKVGKADWLIGNDLIIPAPTRRALRSMSAPGTAFTNDPYLRSDPQPDHIKKKYTGSADYQGVHINSGIPNHAFYTTAMELTGYSWERAGKIWYDALLMLGRTANFAQCAQATHHAAAARYGAGSKEQKAVASGWKKVGINV